MGNTKMISKLLELFHFRIDTLNRQYCHEFISEIRLLNLARLKILGYFAIVFAVLQVLSDIFLKEFWETHQVSNFMKLDIFLLAVTLVVIVVTHTSSVTDRTKIKGWHVVFVHTVVISILIWASLVSVIEYRTLGSTPTYLITVFMMATIFIFRSLHLLIYYIPSLLAIYIGFYLSGIEPGIIFTHHAPLLALIIIAWIVSRILYLTRVKSYLSTKELEQSKNNLDMLVKARTVELSTTNDKLIEEINERRRYEKRLEEEHKNAQKADHLKSLFLANMSHEIRTPLNGIIGFGDLLKNPNLTQGKKERYLEIISNNSQQLLKIIEDIMDISLIESNQLKLNPIKFRLSTILPETIVFFTNFKKIVNKDHIKLINDGFPDNSHDTIFSDASRVQQVLYNLIGNAIKFTQKGHIKIGGKVEEGFALIYVEDTGIGVDPAKCDMIFHQFRQGEETITRTYGGTGLGLSISKGLIELLGGMIWIDLSYTAGSRFCFSLPTEESTVRMAPEHVLKMWNKIGNRCIIIAENDKSYRGILTNLMKTKKTEIPVYPFDAFQPDEVRISPEIIIYDMPSGSNLLPDHISTINSYFDKVPTLVLTDHIEPDLKSKLHQSGCSGIFLSPVNIFLLLNRILKLANVPSG